MSNYIEYKDKLAFHPGYYIKEIIDESGLTQEDFAKRLDTTPKNLSLLIRGEQSLSIDIAMKLSRMLGTSVAYWLNMQRAFDVVVAALKSDEELQEERNLFQFFDYQYFCDNFGLSKEERDVDEQIKNVRRLLQVSTLSVFAKPDMTVSFKRDGRNMSLEEIVKTNTLIQLGINQTLTIETSKYSKNAFGRIATYVTRLLGNEADSVEMLQDAFKESGVALVAVPNIKGVNVNGATKKVGDKVMLLYNGEHNILHEVENILNGNYGVTFQEI